jgi:hypothetical protein
LDNKVFPVVVDVQVLYETRASSVVFPVSLAGPIACGRFCVEGLLSVPIQKSENLVEIKARGKFNRRHMVDIPRNPFFAQRRYRANWPFMDGHDLNTENQTP